MNWIPLAALVLASTAEPLQTGDPHASLVPPPVESVFQLPPELRAQIRENIVMRTPDADRRRDLLVEFMFSQSGLGFRYDNDTTRPIGETWELARGNCLSFTMLFIAAAREVGLRAQAREVRIPPSWSRQQDTVYRVGHINVGVRTRTGEYVVDFEPDLFRAHRNASPFRGREISDERLFAHFYNNRAAELLGEGRAESARAFVDQALELDPEFAPAWNTRGVVLARLGLPEEAEQALLKVLEISGEDPDALLNLLGLYRAMGDEVRLAAYQARLEQARPDDPYFQFELGQVYENKGDLERAEQHYRRAVRQIQEEHRFHFALARVFYLDGDDRAARDALLRAFDLSSDPVRDLYASKLHALKIQR